MADHDPLCPTWTVHAADKAPCGCRMCRELCQCVLIREVRADEQGKR